MGKFRRGLVIVIGIVAIFSLTNAQAQKNPDDIIGTWLTQDKDGKVEIYKQGSEYFGKIVWMNEPNDKNGKPKLDTKNPDPSKRSQLIQGMVIVKNLKWDDGEWENGKVYDPGSGKLYSAEVKLKDRNTLQFTGYIGLSFIGRTETWTRLK